MPTADVDDITVSIFGSLFNVAGNYTSPKSINTTSPKKKKGILILAFCNFWMFDFIGIANQYPFSHTKFKVAVSISTTIMY